MQPLVEGGAAAKIVPHTILLEAGLGAHLPIGILAFGVPAGREAARHAHVAKRGGDTKAMIVSTAEQSQAGATSSHTQRRC
jgi:hypothetical protein